MHSEPPKRPLSNIEAFEQAAELIRSDTTSFPDQDLTLEELRKAQAEAVGAAERSRAEIKKLNRKAVTDADSR